MFWDMIRNIFFNNPRRRGAISAGGLDQRMVNAHMN